MRIERGFILISVLSSICLITGLIFAQEQAQESALGQTKEEVPSQPAAEASVQIEAATTVAPVEGVKAEPEIQWVWGEVISTNPINNELLVKYVDYDTDTEKEIIIGADDKTTYDNAKSMDEIKVRDSVSVDYAVSADGKNLALNISLERPETMEESSTTEIIPAEVPNEDNTAVTSQVGE